MKTDTSQVLEEFLVIKVSLQIGNICHYLEDAKKRSDGGAVSIDAENLRRIEDQAHILLTLAGYIHEKLLHENEFAKPEIRNSNLHRLAQNERLTEYREVKPENVLNKLAEISV